MTSIGSFRSFFWHLTEDLERDADTVMDGHRDIPVTLRDPRIVGTDKTLNTLGNKLLIFV